MLVDYVDLVEETDIGFLWMHSLAAWLYESRCAGFLTGVSPARFLLTEIYNRCVNNSTIVLFRTLLFTVECNLKCRATELRTKWTGRELTRTGKSGTGLVVSHHIFLIRDIRTRKVRSLNNGQLVGNVPSSRHLFRSDRKSNSNARTVDLC